VSEPANRPEDADEALLAEVFDLLFEHVLEGRTPDFDQMLPHRPDLRPRVEQAWSLACSVAGRREPGRPVLGGYEIVRELGHGGMGTVYLARHQSLDREVAIKILPQSLALSPRAKRRFLAEARALARIRHEHVVHLHRIVDHAEMLAFEMEYVDGPSLQQLIVGLKQRAPAGIPQLQEVLGPEASTFGARSTVEYFVRIGIAIARALEEVHRRGLIHRDVKPSNVLMRRNGQPVLADFGLARTGEIGVTQTQAFAGTPLYAAPERLRDGDEGLDCRADVYSLGVTLYEAITLAPPYEGRSTNEVLRKIERGRLPPLRARAPNVSHDLQTVLEKAMEPEPRDRYASAAAFADDLERLLALQPVHARPAGMLRRLAKAARRHRRILLAGAVGAATVALAAWPLVAHAQARAEARNVAAKHAEAARLQLLTPECQQATLLRLRVRSEDARGGTSVKVQVQALTAARDEYDQGLAALPDDPALRRERAVIATVLWLRTRSPDKRSEIEAALASPDWVAATRDLPPGCAHIANGYVGNDVDAAAVRSGLAGKGAEDRFATGLLALLLGDLTACEVAWTMADDDSGQPLIDAGLGLLYAADGLPERAYPRLFHAAREFPAAAGLRIELADAALAMDDPGPARALLADPAAGANAALRPRLDLLAADVAARDGDVAGAERTYLELLGRDTDDDAVRRRMARLAVDRGEPALAREQLELALLAAPELARLHLDLARLCLRMRDLAGYLAQARFAAGRVDAPAASRGARSDCAAILRLGGLQRLSAGDEENGEGEARDPVATRDWRDLELALPPLPRGTSPATLATALRLLASFDGAADRIARVDPRPYARPLHGVYAVLAARPQLAGPLPWWSLPLLFAAAGPVLREGPSLIAEYSLPFQRSLGTPLHHIDVSPIADPESDARRRFGFALASTAGGDGETWLLAGCPPVGNDASPGVVFVLVGRTGDVVSVARAPSAATMFGFAVAWLGDVDGDGLPDYAVGAPSQEVGTNGYVQLCSGRNGHVLRTVPGPEAGFGVAVAGLGDVDGDGVPDLGVGSSPLLRSNAPLGSAVIVSGRDGSVLHTFVCDRAGVWFGAAVADAGDVDKDGVDDLVVGGNLGRAAGLVCVYSGRTGELLHTFTEESSLGCFGHHVGSAGDFDRDGHADVLVGAPGTQNGEQTGRALIYSGRTGALLARLQSDATGDLFGSSSCLLPGASPNGGPAIAIGAPLGGAAGSGFVRVFELRTQRPLQSLFGISNTFSFGSALADLGAADPRRRMVIAAVARQDGQGIVCRVEPVELRRR
jgi:hypothetical protein